jgi:hypothetical protein
MVITTVAASLHLFNLYRHTPATRIFPSWRRRMLFNHKSDNYPLFLAFSDFLVAQNLAQNLADG